MEEYYVDIIIKDSIDPDLYKQEMDFRDIY